MDISGLLSTALAILSVATLAGLGLTRGQITSLREQLADSRAETAAIRTSRAEEQAEHEKERKDEKHRRELDQAAHDAERHAFEVKIDGLTSDLESLRRVVTGEVHWQTISDLLESHHQEAKAYWTRTEEREEKMLDEMSASTRAILVAVDRTKESRQ